MMTLDQMASLKRWHVTHGHRRGAVERQVWDTVLTLWLIGWVGLPVAELLAPEVLPWVCLPLMGLPGLYVAWRAHLHRRGQLRCDWLPAVTRRD